MLFGRKTEKKTREKYKESNRVILNPGMGWYRPYLFNLEDDVDEGFLSSVIVEEERLCLIEINLYAYRESEINREGICHLEQILDFFHENKKDMMLRFAYDFEGYAMEKEPTSLKQIFVHMHQVGEVVKPYLKEVVLFQGLFVGSWGEMHFSRYVTDLSILRLYDEFRSVFGSEVYLALRTAAYINLIENSRGYDPYLTLFDDAIYGSKTDMGTFSEGRKAEEMDMVIGRYRCPVGGEVLYGSESILSEMDSYHLTYLNSQYDKNALDDWAKMGILSKVSLRLGYRFLITNCRISNSGKHNYFHLEVLNIGAGICPYNLTLEVLFNDKVYRTQFAGNEFMPTKSNELVVDLGRDISGLKDSEIQLYRSFDKEPVYFANQGLEQKKSIMFKELWEN